MDFKRALWVSALTYAVTILIGVFVGLAGGVDFENAQAIPISTWYAGMIISIAITVLFSLLYFKDHEKDASILEGFYLGLFFIGVGFLIDLLLVLPYIALSTSPIDVASYYSEPLLWGTLVVIVGTASIVGLIREE